MITEGTRSGVCKVVGEAIDEYRASVDDEKADKVVAIGIAAWKTAYRLKHHQHFEKANVNIHRGFSYDVTAGHVG